MSPLLTSLPPSDGSAPLTVSRFLACIKEGVEATFKNVYLIGEVSGAKSAGSSGHFYFNLKETEASVGCAIWKSGMKKIKYLPKDGDRVVVKGNMGIWIASGKMTFAVTECEAAGAGDLQAKLKELEAKLRAEGLFDKPKRPIPKIPKRIGVIAALGGAALQDVLRVTLQRSPGVDVLVFPATAQGERCIPENLAMLTEAQSPRWGCDVLLMVRGGGSPEDLWGFNDPDLVRKVSQSIIPIVTGVGHEIDTTLVDLASDFRAATPSQAAEYITTERSELGMQLQNTAYQLYEAMQDRLLHPETELNILCEREGLRSVPEKIRVLQHRVEKTEMQLNHLNPIQKIARLDLQMNHLVKQLAGFSLSSVLRERFIQLSSKVISLSPEAPLGRGFVLTLDSLGRPIVSASKTQPGDQITLKWADGRHQAEILKP